MYITGGFEMTLMVLPQSDVVCKWITLTWQCYVFQDTTSGFWTETGFLVWPMTSHKCGVSLLQLTLRSHAATAREKHTFSRWIYSVEPISVFDIFEFSFQECDTLLFLLKTQPWVTFPLVPSTTFIFLVYVYIFRYILVA